MGRIRSRAIRGWRNLWGDGDNAGPQDIDGERGITPVYDVGHAAHWQSRWVKDGWATFVRTLSTAAAGTTRSSFAPTAAFGIIAPVHGNPVTDFGDTACWLNRVSLSVTAGGSNVTRIWGVRKAGDVDVATVVNSYHGLFYSNALTFNETVEVGTEAMMWANGNQRNPDQQAFLPQRFSPVGGPNGVGDEVHIVMVTTAAVQTDINVIMEFWIGSDGGPPPQRL